MQTIKDFFKTLPMPVSGLMVGCASLANLTSSYSPIFKATFGIISLILFILVTIKFIAYPNLLKEDLKNPVLSALAPTYPMGLLMLSVFGKPYLGSVATMFWFLAIAIYVYTFFHFVHTFGKSFKLNNIYLPYLIPFIGFSVITMTSGAFGMHIIGLISFYIAAVSSAILVWPVFYRYIKYPDIPESVKPSFTILSAPIAIILVAYFSIFEVKSTLLISVLLSLSVISYFIVLKFLPSLLKIKFYPSCAAFTFPMTIAASSTKISYYYFLSIGHDIKLLEIFFHFETLIVFGLVVLVIVRYAKNSIGKLAKEEMVKYG